LRLRETNGVDLLIVIRQNASNTKAARSAKPQAARKKKCNPSSSPTTLYGTAYGWWLPNDLRGSGSSLVRSDTLADLGKLHFGRKKIQPAGQLIRDFL